jgi:hypothetical protein
MLQSDDELQTALSYYASGCAAESDDDFEGMLRVALNRSFSPQDACFSQQPEFELPADGYDRPEGVEAFVKLDHLKQQARWIPAIEKHLRLRDTTSQQCVSCNRATHECSCCDSNLGWIQHAKLVRRLSDQDRDNHRLSTETVEWASDCLARMGVVCLENVVPKKVIDSARQEFKETWEHIYGSYISVYQEHYNETVSAKGKLYKEGVRAEFFFCQQHSIVA